MPNVPHVRKVISSPHVWMKCPYCKRVDIVSFNPKTGRYSYGAWQCPRGCKNPSTQEHFAQETADQASSPTVSHEVAFAGQQEQAELSASFSVSSEIITASGILPHFAGSPEAFSEERQEIKGKEKCDDSNDR